MAKSGERRMLFDTRGRRRGVIKVIYASLALLMTSGLLLFGIGGELSGGFLEGIGLGGGGGTTDASEALENQAESIERRLRKNPDDEALLLALARARINAGNALIEVDPATGQPSATPEARVQLEQGIQAWRRYLKQAGADPTPAATLLAAGTFFTLAQTSDTFGEAVANIESAADTQQLVADQRPSVGSFSTLAIYDYFAGDFAAGDRAVKQAQGMAPSKSEAKAIKTQLATFRKRGKLFEKQKRQLAKAQRGQGREVLQNPLGELSGAGG